MMIIRDTNRAALKLAAFMGSLNKPRPYSQEFFNKDSLKVEDKKYIQYALMGDEEISCKTGLHWRAVLLPLIFSIVLFKEPPVLLISGMWLIIAFINYISSEFVITNMRLSLQTGVVKRQALETPLGEIADVDVEQGAAGRILGYGTLVVTVAEGVVHRFSSVSKPFEFRQSVVEQMRYSSSDRAEAGLGIGPRPQDSQPQTISINSE